jgi:serine/threonine protein phosphatase PrpC
MALTQDHRPTIPRERERITAQGIKLEAGQTRLNGLAVSRALGDHFPKEMNCGLIAEPYVSPAIKLNKNDSHLIIASDGVSVTQLNFIPRQKFHAKIIVRIDY